MSKKESTVIKSMRLKQSTKDDFERMREGNGMTSDGLLRHLIKQVKKDE